MDILFFKVYRNKFIKGKIFSYLYENIDMKKIYFFMSFCSKDLQNILEENKFFNESLKIQIMYICLYQYFIENNIIFVIDGNNVIMYYSEYVEQHVENNIPNDLLDNDVYHVANHTIYHKIGDIEEFKKYMIKLTKQDDNKYMNKYIKHIRLGKNANIVRLRKAFWLYSLVNLNKAIYIKPIRFETLDRSPFDIDIVKMSYDIEYKKKIFIKPNIKIIELFLRKIFFGTIYYIIDTIQSIRSFTIKNSSIENIYTILEDSKRESFYIYEKISKLIDYIDEKYYTKEYNYINLYKSILKLPRCRDAIIRFLEDMNKYKHINIDKDIYLKTSEFYLLLLEIFCIDYKKILERLLYYCREDIINTNINQNYIKYIDVYDTENNEEYNGIIINNIYYHVTK